MPIHELRCERCATTIEQITAAGEAPERTCDVCRGPLVRVVSVPAPPRISTPRPTQTRSDWDRYDPGTLGTHAGAREAAYEVAREGGLARSRAQEAAGLAADGMRAAGERVIRAQERKGQRDAVKALGAQTPRGEA